MKYWLSKLGRRIKACRSSAISTFMSMLCFLYVLGATPLIAQHASRQVEDANKLYLEEKYDEANDKYHDALVSDPASPIITFNMGDVEYKKRNYEKALEAYQKAMSSDDIKLQSKAYYNMGNTLYRLGKLPESIIHYKKALELDPEDEDAKYNLEYVRAQLKDKSQKQNQQQEQQQQQKQQQQGQNEEKQNEQEEKEGQEQSGNQEEQQNEQEQPQQEQQQQQQSEQNNSEQEGKEQAKGQEISKEDAERILNALKSEEEDLLKQNRTRKSGGAFRGKDW